MRSEGAADRRELLDRLLDEERVALPSPRIRPSGADRDRLPLSFAQRRLWFIDQLAPGATAYTMAGAARLAGELDAPVLERCLDEVVRRHEVLRTTFHQDDGEPWARVRPAAPTGMRRVDLSAKPPPERAAELAALGAEQAERPFDLTCDPMLRATLVKTADREHVLLLSLHHIAADGWSLGVVLHELAELYGAFRAGLPSPLPPLPVQYADFTVWQREHLTEAALRGHLDYWRERLAGAPSTEIPPDLAGSATSPPAGASVAVDLSADLTGRLLALGERERATPYMTLLAAFASLLYRWTGESDLVVGASVAGRDRAELADLIGFFSNTIPLRLDLSGGPTFRELLRRTRAVCLEGYVHQDAPFEQIVQEVSPVRTPDGRSVLFGHTLVVNETPHPALRLPGLSADVIPLPTGAAKFDLRLEFTPTGPGGMSGLLEYPADRHRPETMRGLAETLRVLLDSACADPDLTIDRLRILSAAEHDRLVRTAAGRTPPAADVCLHELFERSADLAPDAVAVVDGDHRLTYRELDERANRVARLLMDSGAAPEDPVAVVMPRSAGQLTVLLGVLKAGAAFVPLDPAQPAPRLARMIEDSGAGLAVTRSGAPVGRAAKVIRLDDEARRLAALPASRPARPVDPRNAAYVMYTSGSTGRPKGVVVEHRSVVNRVRAMLADCEPSAEDAVLHRTPTGFDVAVGEWGLALAAGARVVVAGPGAGQDPARLVALIRTAGVTTANVVPALLHALLAEPDAAECRSLRRVLCGGEDLPPALARACREKLPDARLYNLYGPTEATIDASTWPVPAAGPPAGAPRTPIGGPVAGARLHVLDEHLRPVPEGVPGELYIGGAPVARGYLGRPGATAERFVPDVFRAGERLYRTGDRVRLLPGGALDFLGRLDRQVKIRGRRIEPGEVEAAIAGRPEVEHALVVPGTSPTGDVRLIAYVTLTKPPPPNGEVVSGEVVAALRAHARERLPQAMVPADFVVLDAWPVGPTGKVDRSALPPPGTPGDGAAPYTEPRTATQRAVAAIWRDLLAVERVGADDDFFERGGHSLLAARLVARVRAAFGVNLPLGVLFGDPTVAGIARHLDASADRTGPIGRAARRRRDGGDGRRA